MKAHSFFMMLALANMVFSDSDSHTELRTGVVFKLTSNVDTRDTAVNGGWGDWDACDATCGIGTQTRACDNPVPEDGGDDCDGDNTQECDTDVECVVDCPVDDSTAIALETGCKCASNSHSNECAKDWFCYDAGNSGICTQEALIDCPVDDTAAITSACKCGIASTLNECVPGETNFPNYCYGGICSHQCGDHGYTLIANDNDCKCSNSSTTNECGDGKYCYTHDNGEWVCNDNAKYLNQNGIN